MTIEIQLPAEIVIPDDELLTLAATIREKWGMKPEDPIHAEDLINTAIAEGLIDGEEIRGWELPLHESRNYTDSELAQEMKTKPRRKPKKTKSRK